MHILQATSEFFPFSKTGGLADMVAGLSGALAKKGNKLSVVTPLYRCVRNNYPKIKPWGERFQLILGNKKVTGRFYTAKAGKGVTVYFVDRPKYYDRDGIYQESGNGYIDNPERYIFFSKCALLLAKRLRSQPDILHCHDWQTGLIPLMNMRDKNLTSRTCLTIHNLAYQGNFDAINFKLTNLPKNLLKPEVIEFYGNINFLKAGIVFANKLTTVSPTYAKEILTEEFGEGLDGVLRNRRADLIGILNGADYQQWRTTNNKFLPSEFSTVNLTGKYKNKLLIRKEFGLPSKGKRTPIYSFIGRLVHQKGIHLLLETLPHLLSKYKIQFMLLGTGDPYLENECHQIASQFPNQIRILTEYNESLAHRIKAGSDFLLMPSLYEPCGLNQMYSLRYGTIPIVNAVGGLNDSIIDINKYPRFGNGFKITQLNKKTLSNAISRSFKLYSNPNKLSRIRKRVMKIDFSWNKGANSYGKIYEDLKITPQNQSNLY